MSPSPRDGGSSSRTSGNGATLVHLILTALDHSNIDGIDLTLISALTHLDIYFVGDPINRLLRVARLPRGNRIETINFLLIVDGEMIRTFQDSLVPIFLQQPMSALKRVGVRGALGG
ncbi:hypothetical protein FB45DRAFT_1042568 [Roridomyces roridus]|uniref:Uncharacterized protein n=1 Tax=Roridomyces roridus TaxID=1738132 RepID=A0AAD7F8Y0_9AGAR|nr:hypothetical protein FB45DRAFT_1042568 [Roridomyces roridus]